MKSNPQSQLIPAILCVFLIGMAGCRATGRTTVKEVAKDNDAYLAKEFAVETLPPRLVEQIKKSDTASPGIKRFRFTSQVTSPSTNGVPWLYSDTFVSTGNGLFQHIRQFSKNGIPIFQKYAVEYRGLFSLKFQRVVPGEEKTSLAYVAKKITRFDPLTETPNENRNYIFEYSVGYQGVSGSLVHYEYGCRSNTYYDAKTVNPKLEGRAINFDCSVQSNIPSDASHMEELAFFEKYGVVVLLGNISTDGTQRLKIVNFEIAPAAEAVPVPRPLSSGTNDHAQH